MAFRWEHDPLCYHDCGLTGYTGVDPDTIFQMSILPAKRVQIGPRGLYKGAVAKLANGDLVACACDSRVPDWPIHLFTSSDNGDTWIPVDHTPLFGKEPGLTCLPDGSLLITLENSRGTVAHSSDGGQTWECTHMSEELGLGLTTVRTPIVDPNGNLSMVRCWGQYEGSPKDSPRSRAWLARSFDGGKTWPRYDEIETWDDSFPKFVETDFLRVPDGRILCASRYEFDHPIAGTKPPWPPKSVPNDHAAGHMVLFESTDEGEHWTEPRDFLSYSEVQGHLQLLSDGRVLCSYTHYHLPFGAAAVVSSDLGRTWDHAHPFQLAVSNGVNAGWASTIELDGGELLTVYALMPYHLEPPDKGSTMVFQCVKWRLPAG